MKVQLYTWSKVRNSVVRLLVRAGTEIPESVTVTTRDGQKHTINKADWEFQEDADTATSDAAEFKNNEIMAALSARGLHLEEAFVKITTTP